MPSSGPSGHRLALHPVRHCANSDRSTEGTGAGCLGIEAHAPDMDAAFVRDADKANCHDLAPRVLGTASVLSPY
jgi:hypothetical protein